MMSPDIDPAVYATCQGIEAGAVAYLVAVDPLRSGLSTLARAGIGAGVFGAYSYWVDGLPPQNTPRHGHMTVTFGE
jgi:hypothetical protein